MISNYEIEMAHCVSVCVCVLVCVCVCVCVCVTVLQQQRRSVQRCLSADCVEEQTHELSDSDPLSSSFFMSAHRHTNTEYTYKKKQFQFYYLVLAVTRRYASTVSYTECLCCLFGSESLLLGDVAG